MTTILADTFRAAQAPKHVHRFIAEVINPIFGSTRAKGRVSSKTEMPAGHRFGKVPSTSQSLKDLLATTL